MNISAEHLLAIARNYWDSSSEFHLRQEASPERERLQALWKKELEGIGRWWAFMDALRHELPGFTLGSLVTPADASFRCIAYPMLCTQLPRYDWVVVGCVSIVAPVYTVYGVEYEYISGKRCNPKVVFDANLPGMDLPVSVISKKIEQTFGFSPVSREIAQTPVPLFVEFKEPPNTTLFHALFTSHEDNLL